MPQGRNDSSPGSPNRIFSAVRFVLSGFDPVSEAQYHEELVSRGGTDVGRYDPSCTHVIVCDRAYDDPLCVAARNDRKALVTASWIDDSVELGEMADATRVLYRPSKDLNGIPGSESLVICLTGYQKQERNDVMKMVGMMGARFSKPLIANQVTHLICYKFEGEKYELAKKVNIKLVNHRWLEDCLKSWEVLPTDNYTKSSWELEILEAEARDSEEENEGPGCSRGKRASVSADAYISAAEKSSTQQGTSAAKEAQQSDGTIKNHALFSTPRKENSPWKDLGMHNFNKKHIEGFLCQDVEGGPQVSDNYVVTNTVNGGNVSFQSDANIKLQGNALSSNPRTAKRGSPLSNAVDLNANNLSYSRKTSRKLDSVEEPSNNFHTPKESSKVSETILQEAKTNHLYADVQSPTASISRHHAEACLPQKRKNSVSGVGGKLPKSELQGSKAGVSTSLSVSAMSVQLGATSASALPPDHGLIGPNSNLSGVATSNSKESQQTAASKFKSLSYKKKSPEHGQTAVNRTTNGAVTLLDQTKPELALESGQKQAVNVSNILRNKLVTLGERTKNDASASEDKMILDLPLNNEQGRDVHASIKNTFLDTLAKGAVNTDETSRHMGPESSLSGLGKPKLDTKSSVGSYVATCCIPNATDGVSIATCDIPNATTGCDIAMDDIANATTEEPGEPFRSKGIGDLPVDSLDTETRKLPSIPNVETCAMNDAKSTAAAHTKKIVARMNLSKNKAVGKIGKMKTEKKFEMRIADEKSEAMEPTSSVIAIEDKLEVADDCKKDTSITCADKCVNRTKRSVKSRKVEKVKAAAELKKNVNKATETVPKNVMEANVKAVQHSILEINQNNIAMDNIDSPIDPEKENKPKENVSLTANKHNTVNKLNNKSMEGSKSILCGTKSEVKTSSCPRGARSEPAWFILSGHHLQRKEFQMVIKRLRGRSCRDSHNWSYQATHFVVPDPVHRTEKFFAAAAAGRWILKTDYLTASSEAGKFLDEEPFEWYRNGLTEDAAISLEAPRKWRCLRERTGHGALFGMKIIIYGDCISPSLDTLKRVVKAGDGTILATSPPYTRFINSGVDYAIISPSMPHVDAWVQEFLRHEIPCIVADYLVEYVCKPGYSLERHVLFKTHAWAEKSFANLLNRSEEIVADHASPVENSTDDISCSVCGLTDREEVMLICGDDGGAVGCGNGTHIDCCEPPLEAIPEGDWFCANCNESRALKTPLKSRNKKPSRNKKCY